MGACSREVESSFLNLVEEEPIRSYMTISIALPVAGERMIAKPVRKLALCCKQNDHGIQLS